MPSAENRATRWAFALRALVVLVGLLVWSAGSAVAWATPPMSAPLPVAEDGEGIKVGQRSTFHPGFALITGVNSNVFYAAKQEGPRAAAFVAPTAWIGIGNRQVRDGLLMSPPERSGRLADYSIRGIGNFRQFLARDDSIRKQSRFSGGMTLRLAILPGRRFEIDLNDDIYRYAQPSNLDAGAKFNFNRVSHSGKLQMILRPGGGRVSITAGYQNQLLRFQNTSVRDILANNRLVNGAVSEIKWRFLPKSSLFVNYDFRYTYYLDCCTDVGLGRNEDNYAHRITGGYRGQLLKKLALDVTGGWGFGYYREDPNGPNFSSFIGGVGLDYFPTLRTDFHIDGYRSFNDSLLGNYFIDNGGRFAFKHQWRWRMHTLLGAAVVSRTYAGLPVPGVEDKDINEYQGVGADKFQRHDTLFVINAKIEQPVKKIWAFGVMYNGTVDSTNFVTFFNQQMGDSSRPFNVAGFNRHVVMLLAAVRI